MSSTKFTYYVSNGYAGSKSMPFTVKIDDEDLAACEDYADREQLIEDRIQEHLIENHHPYWNRDEVLLWEEKHLPEKPTR